MNLKSLRILATGLFKILAVDLVVVLVLSEAVLVLVNGSSGVAGSNKTFDSKSSR